ncbi:MAG: hypothetical protein GY856_54950 [bacterium]|nr:hypothetical protein [bacterium]
MLEVEYLTDRDGNPKAVVLPIELWRQLVPTGDDVSLEELAESIEDYCLNRAMDEAENSPLLSRQEAMDYLRK